MKKYYHIITIVWFIITLLAVTLAGWNYLSVGWHNSWWYFVTAVFSFFILAVRFRQWKKARQNKCAVHPEN
mgnify:CR=1 FL=1